MTGLETYRRLLHLLHLLHLPHLHLLHLPHLLHRPRTFFDLSVDGLDAGLECSGWALLFQNALAQGPSRYPAGGEQGVTGA